MNLINQILDIAKKHRSFKSSDVYREMQGTISRQHITRTINQLIHDNKLVKNGSTASARYSLANQPSTVLTAHLRTKREGMKEHQIYTKLIEKYPFIKKISENTLSIACYVFTEMLNNAIEHSHSKYVEIDISKQDNLLTVTIEDFGIGVFRNVMKKRHLKSEIEAMQDLLKGKTTTAPHSHSGEGIFFTSKIVNLFILESFGYRLRVDNSIPDYFFETETDKRRGTKVTCTLDLSTKKHLNDVFSQFVTDSGEVGFDKTEIKVHLYTRGTTYISRSQARRIMSGLDQFKTIVLDFDRVTTIGQAFADEIFRVFHNNHRGIQITAINTIEPVDFMIKRAIYSTQEIGYTRRVLT